MRRRALEKQRPGDVPPGKEATAGPHPCEARQEAQSKDTQLSCAYPSIEKPVVSFPRFDYIHRVRSDLQHKTEDRRRAKEAPAKLLHESWRTGVLSASPAPGHKS